MTSKIVTEEAILSLDEFCMLCEVEEPYIIEMVEMGILEPVGKSIVNWHFSILQLHRVRKAKRLQDDLNLNLPGVALSLELLEELKELRFYIQRLENQIKLLSTL